MYEGEYNINIRMLSIDPLSLPNIALIWGSVCIPNLFRVGIQSQSIIFSMVNYL